MILASWVCHTENQVKYSITFTFMPHSETVYPGEGPLYVIKNILNLLFILDDLLHVNYLIAGLFLLVMVVFGVWIKFFVSWKRELESSNYDIDDLMVNNCNPIDPKVEKDDVFQNISEEDKNEIKSKTEYHKNDDRELDKSHFVDIHTT